MHAHTHLVTILLNGCHVWISPAMAKLSPLCCATDYLVCEWFQASLLILIGINRVAWCPHLLWSHILIQCIRFNWKQHNNWNFTSIKEQQWAVSIMTQKSIKPNMISASLPCCSRAAASYESIRNTNISSGRLTSLKVRQKLDDWKLSRFQIWVEEFRLELACAGVLK